MKFSVSSSSLLKELQTLNGAISSNTVLPILENFLFKLNGNDLTIYASDLETSMTTTIEVSSKDKGMIAIPAKILLDTLKALPEQGLKFEVKDNQSINLKTEKGQYKLSGEKGDDFPDIPMEDDVTELTVSPEILINAINKTIFAVSTDELRPAMTGVFVELDKKSTTFVATDAHKLVKYKNTTVNGSGNDQFILPKKAMTLLKNALNNTDDSVNISYNKTNAFFRQGSTYLICRLIDAKFPDYNAVLPKENKNSLIINRRDFIEALKRIVIYSSRSTNLVALALQSTSMKISAQDLEFSNEANENLECQYDGEDMEIAFNAKFLIEILNVLDDEEIILKLSTPSRAGLIYPNNPKDGEELVMLVMPIMLNNG